MKILVLNSGSSSIKYSLYETKDMHVLASGLIERIGKSKSRHKKRTSGAGGLTYDTVITKTITDHRQGLEDLIRILKEDGTVKDWADLSCIGHRVVHGGEMFHHPTLINEDVLQGIRNMIPLAPLHNPANLMGIEVTLQQAPNVPQVAVFDTAFHQSMPPHAFHYALPMELYEKLHVRRYGFHGTSHEYVAEQAANFMGKPLRTLNLITMHLGNGASASAIRQGKCVDTSMGMTPLEGLVMGTRCGDLDPAVPFYLSRSMGMSNEEIDEMLNHQSGMKGICGENDMRTVHQLADSGNKNARLALDIYCYRLKKYIGTYFAVLGRVDALVFTGGIGENDVWVREKACEGLDVMGIVVDPVKNLQCGNRAVDIRRDKSAVGILVIPTNEELKIAAQCMKCLKKKEGPIAP